MRRQVRHQRKGVSLAPAPSAGDISRPDAATVSLSQGLFQSPTLAIAEGQKIVDQLSRRLPRRPINIINLENLKGA